MKRVKSIALLVCFLTWAVILITSLIQEYPAHTTPTDTGAKYQQSLRSWHNWGFCQAASGTTGY